MKSWPTGIRTQNNRTKICCVTVTPLAKRKQGAKVPSFAQKCKLWMEKMPVFVGSPGRTANGISRGKEVLVEA